MVKHSPNVGAPLPTTVGRERKGNQSHRHHELLEYEPLHLRKDSNGSMRGAFTGQRRSIHKSNAGAPQDANHFHATDEQQQQAADVPKKHRLPRKKHYNKTSMAQGHAMVSSEDDDNNKEDEEVPAKSNHKQKASWQQSNVPAHPGLGGLMEQTTPAHSHGAQFGNNLMYSGREGPGMFSAHSGQPNGMVYGYTHQGSDALMGDSILNSNNFSPASQHKQQQQQQEQQQQHRTTIPRIWNSPQLPYERNSDKYADEYSQSTVTRINFCENPIGWAWQWCDLTPWLTRDVEFDDDDVPYFPAGKEWTTLAAYVRHYFWNPIQPEFTSLQQFCWSVLIGIIMGVYTAVWKIIIESGIDFVWETVPEYLLEKGIFTELEGWFPLYHYMWIVPTVLGTILSYISVVCPVKIPGQNEWIASLHKSGVQDYRSFWPLWIISTLGMISGLSLGPELPLVLSSGMFGSWLGLITRQSMLQARVLNLTAASAAIGGFFGFPMAGALFVLELPHRSGLQYFEALTPSTISSIVAVIANRLVVKNDVTGYFKYPFLATSLPASIFWYAIVYGFFGFAVGAGYLYSVLWFKNWVLAWFHAPPDEHHQEEDRHDDAHDNDNVDKNGGLETDALLVKKNSHVQPAILQPKKPQSLLSCLYSFGCLIVPEQKYRAAVVGAVVGFICGWVAIFVPHTLFWGEAQLQNLIDKGRTPLPVFEDSTADMVALGYCIIDTMDPAAIKAGFSPGCAALIAISKTFVIGLSLGTGIVGGHFWGPLFVGCAASHFFTDIINIITNYTGIGRQLAVYPCLVILCTMGSAHVVSFRAHTAIMLILTLTITAFSPEDGNPYFGMAGDYSAVFPLLVISVSLSMILSRDMFFYKEQRNRGDILAVPEVLCEPNMEGRPLVVAHNDDDSDEDMDGNGFDDHGQFEEMASVHSGHGSVGRRTLQGSLCQGSTGSDPELAAPVAPATRNLPDELTPQAIEDNFLKNLVSSHSAGYGATDPYAVKTQSNRASPVPQVFSNPPSARASPLPPPSPIWTHSSSPMTFVRDKIGSPPMEMPPPRMPAPLGVVPPPPMQGTGHKPQHFSDRLTELLSMPLETDAPKPRHRRTASLDTNDTHRRTASLPLHFANGPEDSRGGQVQATTPLATTTHANRARSGSREDFLVRVSSFGEVDPQPSLLEQARIQAATMGHHRIPSLPRGRSPRKISSSSNPADFGIRSGAVDSGALAFDEIEQSFNNMFHARQNNTMWNNNQG